MRNRPDELKIRKDLKEKLTAGIDYSREISDDEMKELIRYLYPKKKNCGKSFSLRSESWMCCRSL